VVAASLEAKPAAEEIPLVGIPHLIGWDVNLCELLPLTPEKVQLAVRKEELHMNDRRRVHGEPMVLQRPLRHLDLRHAI